MNKIVLSVLFPDLVFFSASKLKTISLVLFTLISYSSLSQNCGTIPAWNYSVVSTSGSNTTYEVNFTAQSTSNGYKSITDMVVKCGSTTLNTNTTCRITPPSNLAASSFSYQFTAATCASTLVLEYKGYTTVSCGGSSCFSGSAGSTSSSLPVTLTYFTVKSSQLLWQTAMELNNDRFEVERQLEGESEFTQIGEVIGAGNSNSLVDYSFSDESAVPAGNHCYRLKQVDFDGQYEYSEVQCVSLKGEKTASIYPNPFTNEIIIADYATEIDSEVEVTDLQGIVLIRASLDQEVKHISTAELAPGTYFVRVSGTVKKIVKY